MKHLKNDIGKSLAWLRNGVVFVFSWLVIIGICLCLLNGKASIAVNTLLRLFLLVLGGTILFCFWFSPFPFKRMRFFPRLTGFFVMYAPYQLFGMYALGLFRSSETTAIKLACYFGLTLGFYLVCLFIDGYVLKKGGDGYTEKLIKYQQGGK